MKKSVKKGAVKKTSGKTRITKAISKTIRKKKSRTLNVGQDEIFEMVRVRAYDLYCSRNSGSGDEMSDWVKAEQLVRKDLGLGI